MIPVTDLTLGREALLMTSPLPDGKLAELADYLSRRREPILVAWRKSSEADPGQTTPHTLSRSQFNDHIPEILDAFETKLRARPNSRLAARADEGADRWWLKVEDTGPGLQGGPGAPVVKGLKLATESARESDDKAIQDGEPSANVLPQRIESTLVSTAQ